MDRRIQWIICSLLIVGLTGCCNCRRGLGLFGNINSARIASPGTGNIQSPQLAQVPYYNSGSTAGGQQNSAVPQSTNVQNGWRPAGGQPANASNPYSYNPTSFSVPAASPLNTIPAGNLVTATSTSTLRQANLPVQPNPPTRIAAPPSNTNGAPPQPLSGGGMPLTDATRIASQQSGNGPEAGIFNRTWEYIARPSTPQNFAPQYQAPPPTQQNYGNYVMATSSTMPQFSGPRFGQGSPANYSNYSGPVADGWRQRETFNGVPR